MFKVGERIIVTCPPILQGEKGRIKYIASNELMAVEMDKSQPYGHNCFGYTKDSHGIIVHKSFVRHLTKLEKFIEAFMRY